jgi:hypothetical protein
MQVDGSERMRITSAGTLLVATTSESAASSKLFVNGGISYEGRLLPNSASSNGTAASPTIPVGFDYDTGLFSPATNNIGFSTFATERMRIDSSGNVGIGTSSPQTRFEAFGGDARVALAAGSAATLRGYQIASGTTEFASLKAEASLGETRLTSGFSGFGGFSTFYTNGAERMRITSTGNVGIGTSSPVTALHLESSISAEKRTVRLAFDGTFYAELYQNGSGGLEYKTFGGLPHIWFQAGTERMRIDASGNLGLGVTPSAWGGSWKAVELNAGSMSSASNTDLLLAQNAYNDNTNWRYKTTALASAYAMAAGQHRFFTAPSGTAGDAITFTQAMTLDASGRLGVGTTSPGTRLEVYQAGEAAQLRINNPTTTGFSTVEFMEDSSARGQIWAGNSSYSSYGGAGSLNYSANSGPHVWYTNYTERMRIGSAGQIGIAGANYGTSGQVLTSGGSGAAPSWANLDFERWGFSIFTTSGSQVIPSGAQYFILACGGGGAGGQRSTGSVNSDTKAVGGNGGSAVWQEGSASSELTLTVTIGAGGTRGTNVAGGAGGATTVTGSGTNITAAGGAGGPIAGTEAVVSGTNGASSGGEVYLPTTWNIGTHTAGNISFSGTSPFGGEIVSVPSGMSETNDRFFASGIAPNRWLSPILLSTTMVGNIYGAGADLTTMRGGFGGDASSDFDGGAGVLGGGGGGATDSSGLVSGNGGSGWVLIGVKR